MRRNRLLLICLGLLVGCGDNTVSVPTGPTSTAPIQPVVPLPPPTGRPQPAFTHRVEVGDVVRARVTSDDPVCGGAWTYRCRYYGLTVRSSGWLHVTIGWNPELRNEYPLDMGIIDEQGREWVATAGQPAHRGASIMATAGTTYVIEVWSFLSPHEEFELKASLFVQ